MFFCVSNREIQVVVVFYVDAQSFLNRINIRLERFRETYFLITKVYHQIVVFLDDSWNSLVEGDEGLPRHNCHTTLDSLNCFDISETQQLTAWAN